VAAKTSDNDPVVLHSRSPKGLRGSRGAFVTMRGDRGSFSSVM
jgi:hypothetical protein